MVSPVEARLRASLRRLLPLVRAPLGSSDVAVLREAAALCTGDDATSEAPPRR